MQHLERHLAPHVSMHCLEDRPHASFADLVEDYVLTESQPRPLRIEDRVRLKFGERLSLTTKN